MDLSIIIAHYDPGNHPKCIDFFQRTLNSIIEQKEDAVTLDFLNVSFGNSSFLTSLSKLIYNAEKKNKTVRVCARKSSTWQLRSFTSLSKFAKTLEIDWAD